MVRILRLPVNENPKLADAYLLHENDANFEVTSQASWLKFGVTIGPLDQELHPKCCSIYD